MILRQGTIDDIAGVMQVIEQVVPAMREAGNLQWDHLYPNAKVFAKDVKLGQMWVAEIDGVIAGVAALTGENEPEYAQLGWDLAEAAVVVHRVAVSPLFQGKGVAVALMEQAEVVARERGVHVVRVDTSAQNQVTQRLFPKLGYTLSGEIGFSWRPGLKVLGYEKRF